jgi:predicted nucleic acid-binding Zn ribbon protein
MPTNSSTPPAKVLLGCSKCGANLPDGSQFCLQCGKPVGSPPKRKPVSEPPEDANALPSQASRPKRKRRVLLWLLLALLIVVIAWVGLGEGPLAQRVQEFAGWKHDQTILDGPFSVGPHTFRYYKFSLPEGSVNVAIVGQFTAASESHLVSSRNSSVKDKDKDKDKDKTSESDNNIDVSVLTQPAFTVWQNGYATSSIYASGKVAEGKVQADLPAGAGIYYLVFSNKFAPKTSKAVHATVLLRYKSWLPESFRRMKDRVSNWLGL